MNDMTPPEAATRVALLARPGMACDRLQLALREAGADVVLVADPAQTDADSVRAAGARAILVALEPMMEEALTRYDALFEDQAMVVIFDEAELAAKREGWDAARWARHLAAKLNGHDQVLPPAAVGDVAEAAATLGPESMWRAQDDGGFAGEADTFTFELPAELPVNGGESAVSMFDPVLAEMDADPASQPAAAQLLTLDDPDVARVADTPGVNARFRRDLDELHERIADMQLEGVPGSRPASQDGAVLVLAGIGGPDAVRQLLAELPSNFPRPVLIQQRLEGARHDKLVRQMQRATAMPVHLAEASQLLQRGHVYVLPGGIGIGLQGSGLRFQADDGPLLDTLPAADSAVILLSGADPTTVDAAMAQAHHGALVAGQSADGCFDAVASEALVARGAEVGSPAQLARKLAARWPC